MAEASDVQEILGKAKEEEKQYEWPKAVDFYRKALTFVDDSDFLRKGEISEKLTRALFACMKLKLISFVSHSILLAIS